MIQVHWSTTEQSHISAKKPEPSCLAEETTWQFFFPVVPNQVCCSSLNTVLLQSLKLKLILWFCLVKILLIGTSIKLGLRISLHSWAKLLSNRHEHCSKLGLRVSTPFSESSECGIRYRIWVYGWRLVERQQAIKETECASHVCEGWEERHYELFIAKHPFVDDLKEHQFRGNKKWRWKMKGKDWMSSMYSFGMAKGEGWRVRWRRWRVKNEEWRWRRWSKNTISFAASVTYSHFPMLFNDIPLCTRLAWAFSWEYFQSLISEITSSACIPISVTQY